MSTALPAPALGLRLLALAVVAGSGALLPFELRARLLLATGIVTGAVLGLGQYLVSRRALPIPGALFVLAHIANWTWLAQVTGGRHSPFLVGYLLEVPLSALLLSKRGCLLAAIAGAAAAIGTPALLQPPLDIPYEATVAGFLALTTLLTWLTVDVIERQQSEIAESRAALRARAENLAEELRLLGDYLGGALIGLGPMGQVTSINEAGLALLGLERQQAVGHAWQEVLRPDAKGSGAIARIIAGGEAQRGIPLLLARPDGRRVAATAELWVAASGEGRRIWLLLDTERQPGVEGDPLRRLGEAVACVSHQIKNSLHALEGYAARIDHDLVRENGKSQSTRDLLRGLRGLGELAEDVLAMSGAPRRSDERVPLHDVIASAVMLARGAGDRVRVVLPPREVHVIAHRGQLVHALFNLIDNACRVTPPERTVTVCVKEEGGRAFVEIMDGGPGLPAGLEALKGRAPSATGAGYGMLAARRFLEACGADLVYERGSGGGTRCRVSLAAAVTPSGGI